VHAARGVDTGEAAVIGSGTLGLLTIAAIRHLDELRGPLIATAKHPHQRTLAKELGADIVAEPDALPRHIRSVTHSWVIDDRLTCGADHVIDCVGSEQSLQQALDVCAPGGIVHVVGMPARTTLDLTGLWNRELTMTGCYAYTPDDFADALDLVRSADLGRLVSATYPLARYRDAIEHAASAGARGAVKIAFDLRNERERNR
jgi:threonine dehydrogenase-like Zn-dependent dehydrogenase